MTRVLVAPPGLAASAVRRPVTGNPFLSFADSAGSAALDFAALDFAALDFAAAVPTLLAGVARDTGAREPRVAASLVVLGYSARLIAPSATVLLRDGLLLDVAPPRVRFDYGPGFRLALPAPSGWVGPASALVARWSEIVLDDHLSMVVAAVRARVPVAAGLLWGNIASGLMGTLAALVRATVATPETCHAFGAAALRTGPLAGTGELDSSLRFRRRSCCLYYRLPGGGYCGDCSFLPNHPS